MDSLHAWGQETFGRARLPDQRLRKRLVEMVASAAANPGGTVTSVMESTAKKEAAFRFLESTRFQSEVVGEALFESTAFACESGVSYVAIDQTSLSFTDNSKSKGLGPVCYRNSDKLRSLQVMTAYVMDDQGVPVGILDQQTWLRPEENTPYRVNGNGKRVNLLPPEERESVQWLNCLRDAAARLKACDSHTIPWFICDRAADSNALLSLAFDSGGLFTVRSSAARVIEKGGRRQMLHTTLSRQPVLGHVEVIVPAGPGRKKRTATLAVSMLKCPVRIHPQRKNERWEELCCVRVREVGFVPDDEERIEWKLLTNFLASTFEDCLKVLRSYVFRWRIEEFHKTWKSGACDVQSSQLRSLEAIRRWVTIMAAVATRIERLKRLSREQPEMNATQELSRSEIDAAIMLSETSKYDIGDDLTLQQAVGLIAIVGGHMGRKGDGPPGSITIRRGLERVVPAAKVLQKTYG